ncbi:hypothetical protein AB0I22_11735 [Streptomyces sp. NPDC050610]|uniref:hypothetical protein n=1 Tax=Streptomyces sp. NPDC050610 TaxID=3157097 RepID=UPI003436E010
MSAWLRAGRSAIVAATAVLATAGMGAGTDGGTPDGPAAVVRRHVESGPAIAGAVRGALPVEPRERTARGRADSPAWPLPSRGSGSAVSVPGVSVPGVSVPGPSGASVSGGGSSVSASSDGSSASATVRGPGGCIRAHAGAGSSWAVIGRSCRAAAPRPPKRPVPPKPRPPEPRPPEPAPAQPAPPKHPAPSPVPTEPAPRPTPKAPAPPPSRSSAPAATPTPAHVAPRAYHRSVRKRPAGGQSMVTFALLIMAPAVLAAAMLRPRSGSGGRGR